MYLELALFQAILYQILELLVEHYSMIIQRLIAHTIIY